MKTYGLIGYKLGHSFSKKYFEDKFQKENLNNCQFLNFELNNISEFPDLFKNENICGLSCTIPYKQEIIQYLNEIDDEAKAIGAVNAIKIEYKNSKPYTIGYNTDCYGFEMSLKPQLKEIHTHALILGTGGAAQAVKFVLNKLNIQHLSVSRSSNKVEKTISYKDVNKDIISKYKLIINTTPLGTFPNVDDCPKIPYNLITHNHYLYDLVYNPDKTTFIKKGIENGAIIKNGMEMLQLQAEKSWKIWNK